MENVWGILVRAVYGGGRQYASVAELRAAIQQAWDKMDVSVLQKMLAAMRRKVLKVVEKAGNYIGH